VARKNVDGGRRGAAIGDELNPERRFLDEQGRREVHRGAVSAMSDR